MSRFDLLNENTEIMYETADKFEPYLNEKIRMKLHTGEKYEQLKESIQKSGILTPIIAMPSDKRGMLTCISGWNRISICSELGLKIPYQLKIELTEEEADLICIDTNILNRQHAEYLYSELSFILKRKYEILNHQGKTTNTSGNDYEKLENDFKLSRRSIQLYIRLTYLTDELLKMVDENKLSFVVAVTVSFLKKNEMQMLYEYIIKNNYKITPSIATELKKLSVENKNDIDINDILSKINKGTGKTNRVKLSLKTIKKITDIVPLEDRGRIDEIILLSITQYYKV